MHDDFEPVVEKNFSQLLDNGKREVNDKIKKQLAQRIHNYESNRHAYMLKGWKDSDLQEHPELDGEAVEKYRVMTLIADLMNPDRAADWEHNFDESSWWRLFLCNFSQVQTIFWQKIISQISAIFISHINVK